MKKANKKIAKSSKQDKAPTNNKHINQKIEELQQEIQTLKDIAHNTCVDGAVKYYREKLIENATPAELKFKHIAELKHLNLKFQYRINILSGDRIEKVYYVDFCDTKNKIVFEIDGGYHTTKNQIKSDSFRTKQLTKSGYKVFRISNDDVMNGKTTMFLYNIYKSIGIKI